PSLSPRKEIPMSEPTKTTPEQAAYAAAYMDKKRFPLTNRQSDLTLNEQKMLDAINKDDLRELLERGKVLTEEQQAIAREFEEKAKLSQGPAATGAAPRTPPTA